MVNDDSLMLVLWFLVAAQRRSAGSALQIFMRVTVWLNHVDENGSQWQLACTSFWIDSVAKWLVAIIPMPNISQSTNHNQPFVNTEENRKMLKKKHQPAHHLHIYVQSVHSQGIALTAEWRRLDLCRASQVITSMIGASMIWFLHCPIW